MYIVFINMNKHSSLNGNKNHNKSTIQVGGIILKKKKKKSWRGYMQLGTNGIKKTRTCRSRAY